MIKDRDKKNTVLIKRNLHFVCRITAMVIALFGSSLATETVTKTTISTPTDYKLSASIDYAYNKLMWILSYLTMSAVFYAILVFYTVNVTLMIVIYLKTERKNVIDDDEDDDEYIDEIVYADKVNGIKSIAVIEGNNNDGFDGI